MQIPSIKIKHHRRHSLALRAAQPSPAALKADKNKVNGGRLVSQWTANAANAPRWC
jgi:hypothetical protein